MTEHAAAHAVINGQLHLNFIDVDIPHHPVAGGIQRRVIVLRQRRMLRKREIQRRETGVIVLRRCENVRVVLGRQAFQHGVIVLHRFGLGDGVPIAADRWV